MEPCTPQACLRASLSLRGCGINLEVCSSSGPFNFCDYEIDRQHNYFYLISVFIIMIMLLSVKNSIEKMFDANLGDTMQ